MLMLEGNGRMLEVGPGTGYSMPFASPDGPASQIGLTSRCLEEDLYHIGDGIGRPWMQVR